MRVVYNSFDGRFSDSPRTLYEAYRDQVPGQHLWMVDPSHAHGFPAGTEMVPIGSPMCVAALESADLVVANTHIEMDWVKRPDTVYLQVWHGTPLKRIHYDVLWAPPGRLATLDVDVARWDYLVSPNSVSTSRLRAAFGFQGEVLETGYPRTDVLLSSEAPQVRARVRAKLGVAPGRTAVLYTPTWRDHDYFNPPPQGLNFALDLETFAAALGPDYLVLPRLHFKVTDLGTPQGGLGVVDVSHYPDVQELYLAADVLVTDYSSTMFDFAVTGKPMVFYTYDMAEYRDQLRGFYFDLEPIAPGPIVHTPADLLDALRTVDTGHAAHRERYRQFQVTFCQLHDGHAAERLGWLYSEERTPSGHRGQLGPQADPARSNSQNR